tara:strand:+ start:1246 stop:1833 length:588 start_codon:yes stop_codon:yes gene_type:complete
MAQTTLDRRMFGSQVVDEQSHLSDHTITASDIISFSDVGGSNVTKKDTVQGVLDLAGGGAIEKLFIATNSGDQSIANASWTTATFDTEVLDQGGHFASNKFTAPSDGKYMFYATFPYIESSGTGTDQRLSIHHYNSSDVSQYQAPVVKTTIHEASMSGMRAFAMSTNDYMVVQVYQNSGGARNMNKCQFFGWRIV